MSFGEATFPSPIAVARYSTAGRRPLFSKWKRGRYWVASAIYWHRVEGWVCGAWGIDRRERGKYVLTHRPSKLTAGWFPDRPSAALMAGNLERLLPSWRKAGWTEGDGTMKRRACRLLRKYGGHYEGLPAPKGSRKKLWPAEAKP